MLWRLNQIALERGRWLALSLALILAAAAWTAASVVPAAGTTQGRIPSPRAGFLAPELSLATQSGGQLSLADLRGSVVVVNFWASWCPPCRAEMPALRELYLANHARGLEIAAVNSSFQDSRAAADQFVAEHALPFTILYDESGEASRRYLVRALPTTFFVDREGVIRKVVIGGPLSSTTLQSTVEDLLQEGG